MNNFDFNEEEQPRFRRPNGTPPIYKESDWFTLLINYGGRIDGEEYVGGQFIYSDWHNLDYFSLFYLQDDAKKLGFDPRFVQFFFKDLEYGLVEVDTDVGAYNCGKHRNDNGCAEVFILKVDKEQNVVLPSDMVNDDGVRDEVNETGVQAGTEEPDVVNEDVQPGMQETDVVKDGAKNNEQESHKTGVQAGTEEPDMVNDDVQPSLQVPEMVNDGANNVEQEAEAESEAEDIFSDDDFLDEDYVQSDEEPFKCDDEQFNKNVDFEKEDEDNVVHPGEADSEHGNSDELQSLESSSSEEELVGNEADPKKRKATTLKAPKLREWRREVDLPNPKLQVGLLFPNMEQCKEAIRDYGVKTGRLLWFKRNELKRCRVKCRGSAEKECPFLFYASVVDDGPSVMVKRLKDQHICGRSNKSKFCSSSWIAKKCVEQIRLNPNISTSNFQSMMSKTYAMDVTRHQVYKAKQKALNDISGTYEAQYALLNDYAAELLKRNPGSSVYIKNTIEGNNLIFQRIYICFHALKRGFLDGCRKIIGVDGCHLKGPYPGQLLTAVGIDANNGMYPIAYAVVEIENKETWTWFMSNLIEDLEIQNEGNGWVIMSDKQKGLERCIDDLLASAVHRNCVGHLHANFKKDGHGGLALKHQLWAIARSTTLPYFTREMNKLSDMSHEAYLWLVGKPAEKWSRSHFETHTKCDMLLNNLCEAFNKAILDARDKPVLVMLEGIRKYLMLRLAKQRSVQWNQCIGPRITAIIEKTRGISNACHADYSGNETLEISHSEAGTRFGVDLRKKTCDCRKWELTGIPCCHAITALAWYKRCPFEATDDWYKREKYDATYRGYIAPMPDSELWTKTSNAIIKPPHVKIQPGRKKTKRVKPAEEINKDAETIRKLNVKITCKQCGGLGHNKRTCPQIPREDKEARKRQVQANRAARQPGEASTPIEPPAPRRRTRTGRLFPVHTSTPTSGTSRRRVHY